MTIDDVLSCPRMINGFSTVVTSRLTRGDRSRKEIRNTDRKRMVVIIHIRYPLVFSLLLLKYNKNA